MATFLLVWELGAGMGHMANLRPIALRLQSRGHRVIAALREFSQAEQLFSEVPYVASPAAHSLPSDPILEPSTFADLLHNNGCGNRAELSGLVAAWRSLFDLVRPDLVIMEFSPLALLALQGYPAKRVVVGTGFYCPPDVAPLPDLRSWRNNYPDRLRMTEQRVLEALNGVLHAYGQPLLPRVGALYTRLDENFLATFRELDHYPNRANARYSGIWSRVAGKPPAWPDGPGPRIFAYLRPFPSMKTLLDELRKTGAPTLIHLVGTDVTPLQRAAPPNLRFEPDPLDMARVTAECELAILYAPHDTTAAMLLAGKPILQIPQHLEQYLVARNVARLGAGICVTEFDPKEIADGLQALLTDDRYARSARAFAARYADFDPETHLGRLIARLEELAGSGQ